MRPEATDNEKKERNNNRNQTQNKNVPVGEMKCFPGGWEVAESRLELLPSDSHHSVFCLLCVCLVVFQAVLPPSQLATQCSRCSCAHLALITLLSTPHKQAGGRCSEFKPPERRRRAFKLQQNVQPVSKSTSGPPTLPHTLQGERNPSTTIMVSTPPS